LVFPRLGEIFHIFDVQKSQAIAVLTNGGRWIACGLTAAYA